jgi:uncharacterized protein YjdB
MKKIFRSIGLMSLVFTIAITGFGSSFAQAVSYTATDVAVHNTQTDCWIIINNNVYNLTSFVSSHSGGSAVIIAQCGKNGTVAFNSGPHSTSTLNAISSYLLGPLTVTSPIFTNMIIAPTTPEIIIGGKININATPKDQNGLVFTGATTTFSSSNTTIAKVNSTSGLVTGVSVGSATITATSVSGAISITGTSVVTVTATAPASTLTSTKFMPVSPLVKVNKTIKLIVKTKDQNGNNFVGATTIFRSNNPTIATVDSSTGLVTGIAIGSATITATSTYGDNVVTGTVIIKVTDVSTSHENNGEHLGQFKKWINKWFNNYKDKWEKTNGISDKNDSKDNNNEENDD